MKKTLALSFVGVAVAVLVLLSRAASQAPAQKVIAGSGVPDTEDARQITSTVQRAQVLKDQAAFTFDTSRFASVYTDDPAVPLTEEQAQFVRMVRGTDQGAGYLALMTAWYDRWRQGADALEAAQAKAGGRALTPQELAALQDARGQLPAPRAQGTPSATKVTFDSVVIAGDRAIVQYDDGAALYEMTLVRRDGDWMIAGNRTLRIHF